METKKCYKCVVNKPYSDFSKDPNGKYGLSSKCKVCSCKSFKEYYEKNKKKHENICKEIVVCEECLLEYRKSGKTSHCSTLKHKKKCEEINKSTSIEGIIEKK